MSKGIFLVLVIVLLLVSLSSCSKKGYLMRRFSDDDSVMDSKFESILKALDEKDADALTDIFSKQARIEANDFDESINVLHNFYQGVCQIWKRAGGPAVYESIDYGDYSKKMSAWYDVETAEQNYLFYIVYFPLDTANADNEGVYTLRVMKSENKETYFTTNQAMELPGVHIPEIKNCGDGY